MSDRPFQSITGTVDAPMAATWDALLAVVPELQPWGAISGIRTDVDPLRREIAQQGEWWYRGVVSVADAGRPGASAITRTIYNIAPVWNGWLVQLVHRHDPHAFLAAHEALLRAVAGRLGCGYGITDASRPSRDAGIPG